MNISWTGKTPLIEKTYGIGTLPYHSFWFHTFSKFKKLTFKNDQQVYRLAMGMQIRTSLP